MRSFSFAIIAAGPKPAKVPASIPLSLSNCVKGWIKLTVCSVPQVHFVHSVPGFFSRSSTAWPNDAKIKSSLAADGSGPRRSTGCSFQRAFAAKLDRWTGEDYPSVAM